MTPKMEYRLGRPHPPLEGRGMKFLAEHAGWMVAQSRRFLLVYSHRLDPSIYGRERFVDGVRRLVTGHPRARVEILVADAAEAARAGHALLYLAQDLPSRIAIRRQPDEDAGDGPSFMVVDGLGVIHRPHWNRLDGVRVEYAARGWARRLEHVFESVWVRSDLSPELRRLHL